MHKDIYKTLINKPWGNEYCVFKNSNLSIWLLKINPDKKTSLHCHPTKKTGLILLGGQATISLIERTFVLDGFKKIILRNGMFHQTHNTSQDPIYLIEVETPDNKFDLIRIEDEYGRKHTKFEEENKWDELPSNVFTILPGIINKFNNLQFEIIDLVNIDQKQLNNDDLIIILNNAAFKDKLGQYLCECGEVLTYKIFKFLKDRFEINDNINAIIICKT